ncbi:hypothetical protein ACFX2I_041705 [Malus domestica]
MWRELTPTLEVARDTSSTSFHLHNCTSLRDIIGQLGGDMRADTLNMSSPNNLAAVCRRIATWKEVALSGNFDAYGPPPPYTGSELCLTSRSEPPPKHHTITSI